MSYFPQWNSHVICHHNPIYCSRQRNTLEGDRSIFSTKMAMPSRFGRVYLFASTDKTLPQDRLMPCINSQNSVHQCEDPHSCLPEAKTVIVLFFWTVTPGGKPLQALKTKRYYEVGLKSEISQSYPLRGKRMWTHSAKS